MILVGLIIGCAPSATDSRQATAQATQPDGAQSAAPAGATVLELRGQAGSVVGVALLDQSGSLTTARSASVAEIQRHETDFVGRDPIIGRNLGAETVLVLWAGSACDTTGQLVIGPDVASILYKPDPRPGCDAINIVRGVVLTFDHAVVAAGVALGVGPEQIIEQ
jgi:hypothetical protein